MRFGISIYCISREIESGEITAPEAYRRLCGMGAEAIELVPFGFDPSEDPAVRRQLCAVAETEKVPIGNYSLNANFLLTTPEEFSAQLARAKRHIATAADMGIGTIRVDSCAFRRPISENTIENFIRELPQIVAVYEELCDCAADYKMSVLLENHGFHANGSDRVRLILDGVKRSNFGHQLDIGNYACVDERPESAVKRMLPYARTIHAKDFYIRPPHRDPGGAEQFKCENSWFRSVSGAYLRGSILAQGDIDMWQVLGDVKKSGFNGDVYLEYEGMEECEYATAVSFANLLRLCK